MVFTNGCFDIIHAGHIKLLRKAASYGPLMVGLNSDESMRLIKREPINTFTDRRTILLALRYVDGVMGFDEPTPERLIENLRPKVLVKGADYAKHEIVGADFVESYGGRVVRVPHSLGFSTTEIIERINARKETNT
jgi:rfaE bifunctional protein nucleotidyltransferase chain/domain